LPDGSVAGEDGPLILQAQERLPAAAAEGVGQHLPSMTKHEERIVQQDLGEMPQLDPAGSPEAWRFPFFEQKLQS
jgi:hypothetical protein